MIPAPKTNPPVKFPPPPRMIRRRSGADGSLGFLIFFLLLVFILGGWQAFSGPARILIASNGTPVTARIDQKEITRAAGRGSRVQHFMLHYSYTLNGDTYRNEQRVQPQAYSLSDVGQPIPAFVQQLGPWNISRLDLQATSSLTAMLVVAAVWPVIFGLVLLSILVPRLRARRLLREGTAAAGMVTGQRVTRGRSNTYRIRYNFKTSSGKEMTRESTVSRKSYDATSVGSPVTVLYDPAKPTQSVPYEYCSYEIVPAIG